MDVVDLEAAREPLPPGAYDGVLAGGSVRGSRYRRALHRFLRRHRRALAQMPLALFSVCLTGAARSETARAAAAELPLALLRTHGLRAVDVAVFGGALRFSRHGRLGARLLYEIHRRYLGRTDMSEDCEFTDWDEVERLDPRFLASLPASTHTDA